MSNIESAKFSSAAGQAAAYGAKLVQAKVVQAKEPAAPAAPEPVNAQRVDPKALSRQLQEVVQELNKQMERSTTSLGFSVDNATGRDVVKVINKDSGEVVRQIPSEDLLRLAHSMETLKGILYNKHI